MRVLVTGGGGFIGRQLVDHLLDQGNRVVVVDNFVTGRRINLAHVARHPELTVLEHDMNEPGRPASLGERFDRVFSLASPASPVGYSRFPIETHMVNTVGTLHALEIARQSGARLVQASTSEIYGDPSIHPQPETYWGNVNPHGPRSCYNEGKRFAESLTMEFVLARSLLALMETDGLAGEVVNLGNPVEITVRGFAETVVELTNSRSKSRYEPLPVDDPTRRRPDIAKARRLLGWEPEIEFRHGLRVTLDDLATALNQ